MPKVVISALNSDLNAAIDPRFGKCRYLIFVDPETMEFEVVEPPHLMSWGEEAAVRTARLVSSKGVQAVITGPCGADTQQALSAAQIQPR